MYDVVEVVERLSFPFVLCFMSSWGNIQAKNNRGQKLHAFLLTPALAIYLPLQ